MSIERFVNPPLKRHPTLQPLSREHFHGLTLVRGLREAASGDEGARHAAAELMRRAWSEELEAHFSDEERMLCQLVSEHDLARMIEEHRALERHIRMAMECDAAPSPEWLRDTAEMLERHIRWEERELFPAAERDECGALDRMGPEAARIERERPGSRRRQDAG